MIMVFNAEFQHPDIDYEKIEKMLRFYTDSSDMGKLYINYPMMESYKHLKSLPDPSYKTLIASPRGYKELVHKTSKIPDKREYGYDTFARIAVHNISKVNHMLNNDYSIKTRDDFLNTDWCEVFDCQREIYLAQSEVWVLNTICLFIIDYNPGEFFKNANTHQEKYLL